MIPRPATAQHEPAPPSAADIAAEVAKRLPPQQSAPAPAVTKPQLMGRVLVAQFERLARFYQHPPVYFERIDAALYVTMTNQTGRPLYVQGYSVAALVRGHWQTFHNLYGLGFDPYEIGLIAPDRSFLARFDLTENGFDYVMRKRPLGTDEAIETWMFLNSGLSSADRSYITKFRITIYDSTKREHTFYYDYPDKLPRVGPLKTLPHEPVPTNLREE